MAGGHADNGVYFVNQTSGESAQVDPSDIVTNNPSELIVLIPELVTSPVPPGKKPRNYRMVARPQADLFL
jgi:hypothetical protein